MAGPDRIPCPHCGSNNMRGATHCWRCRAPLALGVPPGYPQYPFYAARPRRGLSCGLIVLLLFVFLCAGGGLAGYVWYKFVNPEARLQQRIDEKLETDTERRLDELLKEHPDFAGGSNLPGVTIGMTKEDVLGRLGRPMTVQQGYVITEEGQALSREVWSYGDGWVMFRYNNVVESGPNPPPILTKEIPGPVGAFGGGYTPR